MLCFLDMDGVLTDFTSAALRAHGRDPAEVKVSTFRFWEQLGLAEVDFWAKLSDWTFWAGLPWTADGREILDLVETKFGPQNICLCSSPSWAPGSLAGKLAWIGKHLPDYRRQYIFTPMKYFLAGPHKLLVDDNWENCQQFVQHGGARIIVPRPWNPAGKAPDNDPVRAVRVALDRY